VTDTAIVDLYWRRDETAVRETEIKYSGYLAKIAFNVLADREDAKECVNDTYLKAWNSMPTHKPSDLSTYLGKITRELSIDVYRKKNRKKRQSSQYALSLSEIGECVPSGDSPELEAERGLLLEMINAYLRSLSKEARTVFVCRYHFMDSVSDIAKSHGISKSNVKVMLHRARLGLREYLKKGGFSI
jgi:RNA polymerase sigma-70 factor (ECF subfamily)